MKNPKLFFILVAFAFGMSVSAQKLVVENGVATYTADTTIGKKFPVPDSWNKIVIDENVTITGSFYMGNRSKPIEILGKNRKTSIIQGDGSRPTDDGISGRSYSAIRCDGSPDLYVHDLKVTKPMKFHIHGGFGNVTVERCDIIAGAETATTDGIHGGIGKTIVRDCYIDVFDDALYTVECKLVENTTIVHNHNGGPFMTAWGASVPDGHVCVIRNCKVIDNSDNTDYNHGIVSWAGKNASGVETLTLKFEGTFEYTVNPGKQPSPFYTIGKKSSGLSNAHIVIDGICPQKTSIDLRGSTNSSVTFKNCLDCTDKTAPTIPGTILAGNVTYNSVDLSWGASTDDVAVTGYEIYVDGTLKSTSATTTATISGLICEKQYSINILAFDACGNKSDKNSTVNFTTSICPPCTNVPTITGGNGAEAGQAAYISMTLPTTILAENVDSGDNGVAYYDYGYGGATNEIRPTWSTEHGFRLDSDIEYDDDGTGNTIIGGINSGEWAEYTVTVPAGGGSYRLSSVKYSTNSGVTGKVWFKIGKATSCLINLPNTNKVISSVPVNFEFTLPEGDHVFTWISEAFGFNLDEFVIDASTSVKENTATGNLIKVFPNPVQSIVFIETFLGEPRLFDLSGKELKVNVSGSPTGYKLDVEKLSTGLYFVKAGNSVVKVIKE